MKLASGPEATTTELTSTSDPSGLLGRKITAKQLDSTHYLLAFNVYESRAVVQAEDRVSHGSIGRR